MPLSPATPEIRIQGAGNVHRGGLFCIGTSDPWIRSSTVCSRSSSLCNITHSVLDHNPGHDHQAYQWNYQKYERLQVKVRIRKPRDPSPIEPHQATNHCKANNPSRHLLCTRFMILVRVIDRSTCFVLSSSSTASARWPRMNRAESSHQ